jgi:DNA-binding CsgD family transcriptional regulator
MAIRDHHFAESSSTQFEDLIAAVYEAAFDPSLWLAFLKKFESAIGGYGTGLLMVDLRAPAGSSTTSTLTPEAEKSYNEYYHAMNPWLMAQGRSFLLKNEAGVGESVLSASDLQRTEFYQDWLRPQGLLHCIGSVVLRTPSLFVLLSSLRDASRGPFKSEQLRLVARIRPHVQRAVEAQRRRATDLQVKNASVAALDRLPYGWIVAEANGRAVHLNAAAERMTAKGGLDLRDPNLRMLIERVAKTGLGGDRAMPRRTGRPLWVSVLPLRGPSVKPVAAGTLVGIVVSDPDHAPVADAGRIRRFWKLTPAESALAAELVRGLDVAAAAELLGVTRTTARNQLRSILNKTGAHRQSELLRLLMTAPPQIQLD